jgi:hypothetical protein
MLYNGISNTGQVTYQSLNDGLADIDRLQMLRDHPANSVPKRFVCSFLTSFFRLGFLLLTLLLVSRATPVNLNFLGSLYVCFWLRIAVFSSSIVGTVRTMRRKVGLNFLNVSPRDTYVPRDSRERLFGPALVGQDCLDNLPGDARLPRESVCFVRRERKPKRVPFCPIRDMSRQHCPAQLSRALIAMKTIPEPIIFAIKN